MKFSDNIADDEWEWYIGQLFSRIIKNVNKTAAAAQNGGNSARQSRAPRFRAAAHHIRLSAPFCGASLSCRGAYTINFSVRLCLML